MNAMPAWNKQQIARFVFRQSLFSRRGLSTMAAEALADQLATRDYQRDDRRTCLECSNLQRGGTCFTAAQGNLLDASAQHRPVADLLFRCDHFDFQKP